MRRRQLRGPRRWESIGVGVTLIPGTGPCIVCSGRWCKFYDDVIKLLSSFLLLKAPKKAGLFPLFFRVLMWSLYLRGLGLKLVLVVSKMLWVHVWLCPGIQHCHHLQQPLNSEGRYNSLGVVIGEACEANWCLKQFDHLRDSFKLGLGSPEEVFLLFHLTQGTLYHSNCPKPLTQNWEDCWSNLPGYRGALFSQAVKDTDIFQLQQEKILYLL